jgi:hypothetical protein
MLSNIWKIIFRLNRASERLETLPRCTCALMNAFLLTVGELVFRFRVNLLCLWGPSCLSPWWRTECRARLCSRRGELERRLHWKKRRKFLHFLLLRIRVTRGKCYAHKFLSFFNQFSAKKLAFSQIPMIWVIFFNWKKLAVVWVKNATLFAIFFA